MKTLCFILLISLSALPGCTKYQYLFVNSHLEQNETREFIRENDTVRIIYSFSGENLPVGLTLYNKLQQPLYIDLERTIVVINNQQVNGPFYGENQTSFIAPLSYVKLISYPLRDEMIEVEKQDTIFTRSRNNLGVVYSYDETLTPLFFRVILAVTTMEDYSNPTFFDYSFWVSDILQTRKVPRSVGYKHSDMFYIANYQNSGRLFSYSILLLFVLITAGMVSG